MTALSTVALALSAYLSWRHLAGGSVIGCGGGSPCERVLTSRWSTLGGVLPVSGLAVGAYLAMSVAGLFIGPATEASVRRLAWRAMLVLAGAVAGSAIWFIIVQKWIIGDFCLYCMATHLIGLLLAALVIWRAPVEKSEVRNPKSETTPNLKAAMSEIPRANSFRAFGIRVLGLLRISDFGFRILPLAGLALAGILAVCQAGFTPPPVYQAGESPTNLPAVDPRTGPLLGSPDAAHVVTLLFDFKCSHCQQLHFMLDEAVRRYHGELAFALCPAPLSTQCNPCVPRDVEAFKDSCELAKIGLAVWLASREAFPAFELWMFSLESGDRWQPRSADAARAKAAELVGQTKFEAALADPWIARYLQSSMEVFGRTGGGAIPKLVFGSRWVIPQPHDADDLVSILQASLAVSRPGPAGRQAERGDAANAEKRGEDPALRDSARQSARTQVRHEHSAGRVAALPHDEPGGSPLSDRPQNAILRYENSGARHFQSHLGPTLKPPS